MHDSLAGYHIIADPRPMTDGRWAVAVIIQKSLNGVQNEQVFVAEDGIHYILEVEAAKEAINLGKNLITKGRTDF